MTTRRNFLSSTAKGTVAAALGGLSVGACTGTQPPSTAKSIPLALSTWPFGTKANDEAWKIMAAGGNALDAVEAGVKVIEAAPENSSVGYGGLPDRDGRVTLDACIMNAAGDAGSVSCIEHIMHPISVARRVMEETPHVMLVGDGALQFALEEGFKKENLLTEKSRKAWEEWKLQAQYEPVINAELHDTIGMITIDAAGDIAGACTTSGLAFKMHGRVGDSPVIGAGMYVDNEVGGAAATGMGELVLKTLGSFLIVELMRRGMSPRKACEEAIARIVHKQKDYKKMQVGYIATNKAGDVGAYSLQPGFSYALYQNDENKVVEVNSYL
ncbi:MAG: glycosylasparaginase [Saprospiraceae bacterium]|nr:MAG: glycosylasparaginase [Saprospiraceae bacterium]